MFAKKYFNVVHVAELNTNLCKNDIKNYHCYEQSVSIKLAKLGHLSLHSQI